ncbi:MAG: nuclear transport factor 2 family protein [Limnohabitans sp.]|jgi:ketosteroid isomerase-like protein|nr:nuclear transport factor 2 family protein [Limnohabitans sp.]
MSTDADIIAQLEALDQQRTQSILQRNFAALAPLLGDDLRYIHSSAVQENKAQYLEKLTNGHYIYHGLDVQQREFRVLGDVVLVNGDLRIDVEVKNTRKVVLSRYLQVWARRPSGWQMVSWQSVPVPNP